ncbi:hypothetical protein [uncultured Fretibacterium sp.]|mgnify:FL=1|uniref:hypothetical protein n=1 Tax=uncultured Fretibacterium sp. TaxID=1678694 RepID=UPI0026395DD3|nr:hypothetical protein [uncultured Fretibacterium sp.]
MRKANKTIWAGVAIAAVLASGAVLWVLRTPPPLVQEQTETARRLEEIRENFQRSVQRGDAIVRETERKVVTVRERTVETMRRVSDDAVADLLNAELVLWQMEDGAAGLDDS